MDHRIRNNRKLLLAAALSAAPFSGPVAAQCDWAFVTDSGPSPRRASGVAFDSNRGVLVLWGGRNDPIVANHYFRELWEWDGQTWTLASNSGPPAASSPHMAFDSSRNRTIVYGGKHAGRAGETWEWDGSNWQQTATVAAGPGFRDNGGLAFDSVRNVSVLFGGTTPGGTVSDTWEYNGTWTRVFPAMSPSARYHHSMVYDAARGTVLLFGGLGPDNTTNFGETWSYDGQIWTLLSSSGPAPRRQASMTYDVDRAVVILFGGRNNSVIFGDTWEWDGVQWSLVSETAALGTRWWSAMASVGGGRAVLHGGSDATPSTVVFGDTWELDCEVESCYANCDGSTTPPVLNVDDFTCYINEFAAAQSLPHEQQVAHYANCDDSTTAPALNVDDFTCFINSFAAGCP